MSSTTNAVALIQLTAENLASANGYKSGVHLLCDAISNLLSDSFRKTGKDPICFLLETLADISLNISIEKKIQTVEPKNQDLVGGVQSPLVLRPGRKYTPPKPGMLSLSDVIHQLTGKNTYHEVRSIQGLFPSEQTGRKTGGRGIRHWYSPETVEEMKLFLAYREVFMKNNRLQCLTKQRLNLVLTLFKREQQKNSPLIQSLRK